MQVIKFHIEEELPPLEVAVKDTESARRLFEFLEMADSVKMVEVNSLRTCEYPLWSDVKLLCQNL